MSARTHTSQPYTRMAAYYDLIYHNLVDYKAECEFLQMLFKTHSKRRIDSILDLGCGTGNHAVILAKRGYKVTGIDVSESMLQLARKKVSTDSSSIHFKRMDMRRVSFKQNFDAALILFGAFTYLLLDTDVDRCFSSVRAHLNPSGLLIFEFWHSSGMYPAAATSYGHRPWERHEDQRKNRLLIRLGTSRYDPLTNLMNVIFDHYVIDSKTRRMIDQFQERHVMRTYNITEIERLLRESDLIPLAFYEKGVTYPPKLATISSGRVICVATPGRR